MKDLNETYKKCYILNTILGVGALAYTVSWYRRLLKSLEDEHKKTQETIRDNVQYQV